MCNQDLINLTARCSLNTPGKWIPAQFSRCQIEGTWLITIGGVWRILLTRSSTKLPKGNKGKLLTRINLNIRLLNKTSSVPVIEMPRLQDKILFKLFIYFPSQYMYISIFRTVLYSLNVFCVSVRVLDLIDLESMTVHFSFSLRSTVPLRLHLSYT